MIKEEVTSAIKFQGVEKAMVSYAQELLDTGTVFDGETAFQTGSETAMKMLQKAGLDPYQEELVASLAQTFFQALGNSGKFVPESDWFTRTQTWYTPMTY